jgi:UDP-glucuronate 4-epimerase
MKKKKIIITGSCGFIGFHVAKIFLKNNFIVIGIDNINSYYDKNLKKKRNLILKKFKNYKFYKLDIRSKKIDKLFSDNSIVLVIHLAAQAGVRYSFTNPEKYFYSNLSGFFNIIENIRKNNIKNFFFASTSSVYGNSNKSVLSETDLTDKPIQFYAATKKSNEVMAYSYSSIYNLNMICLRFFTVYGPWGRPDMSLFKFVKAIKDGKKIDVFNYGKHSRSFTYIDDIAEAIFGLYKNKRRIKNKFEIYNLGNNKSIRLIKFIKIIENKIGKKSKKNLMPLQKGDVVRTKAKISKIRKILPNFPKYNLEYGVKCFIDWYNKTYK